MRPAPTFNYLAWGTLVGAIILGCSTAATTDEPTTPEPAPSTPAPDEGQPDAPHFEAKFGKDGGGSSTTKDAGTEDLDCFDPNDPGSAENVARALPDTNDCDNSYRVVNGVANGPVDVDFYKLSATDEGVSLSHPIGCSRETDFSLESENAELCVFASCQNAAPTSVTACEQGKLYESPSGMKGCCVEGPGQAIPTLGCSGTTKDDSATFFIRVRQLNTEQCLPYKFRYRY